jgi:predicted Zn-dependent protease
MEFARASLDRGDRAAAAHWCVRALARDDTRVDAAALLGRLRREDGQYPGAEEVLEAAVRKDPGASLAWYELALVRIDTGHLDEGIVALLASVDADPRSIDAWSALVSALRSAGREEEASAAERSVEKLRSPRAR